MASSNIDVSSRLRFFYCTFSCLTPPVPIELNQLAHGYIVTNFMEYITMNLVLVNFLLMMSGTMDVIQIEIRETGLKRAG